MHAFIHPPSSIHHYPSIHAPSTHAFRIYPSIHHPSTVSHRSIPLTIILLPSFLMGLSTHPYVYHLPIHPPVHPLSIPPSIIHPLSVHHIFIIYLERGQMQLCPQGVPSLLGGGAGRQCALSPRCPHLESSHAGSVACRAGKGSRVQRPQAGRRERAVSWVP